MNIKILPILLSTILLVPGSSKAFVSDDVYKVNNMIWMKNLYFRDGQDFDNPDISKVIEFDITFHSTALPYEIYAHIDETQSKTISPPSYKLDSSQGMQYQNVKLNLPLNFVSKISRNELFKVTYGDLVLFQFNSPALLGPINSFRYDSLEDLPDSLIFKNVINLPRILNGKIEPSYYETVDLSMCNFNSIKEYYYGLFPEQYLWIKFESDLYDKNLSYNKLISLKSGCYISSSIYFNEPKLFENYHSSTSSQKSKPYWDFFEVKKTINGYHNLGFLNYFDKVTLKDGTMRIKSELSDYELKNNASKLSKFITYPLDEENYSYYYNLAKNMEIKINIEAGIYQNFQFSVSFNLNLKNDYFYNHLQELKVVTSHDNDKLNTVDIYYA